MSASSSAVMSGVATRSANRWNAVTIATPVSRGSIGLPCT